MVSATLVSAMILNELGKWAAPRYLRANLAMRTHEKGRLARPVAPDPFRNIAKPEEA